MGFRVTLIRHGQTNFNVKSLIHTSSDDTINDHGRNQAEQLGKMLEDEKFTRVYSSDLMRCQDTAKGVLGQLKTPAPPVILDRRLRERDYGCWDGKPFSFVYEMAKEKNVEPKNITAPDGETYEAAAGRIIDFFEELFRSRDESDSDENVAIFSHGLTIQFLLKYFSENKKDAYIFKNFNFDPNRWCGNTGRTAFIVGKLDSGTGKREIEFTHYYDESHLKQ